MSDRAGRAELLRALAHLGEPPGPAHGPLADALGLPEPPDSAGYAELFVFQLYPHASVHLGPEGMIGGEAAERVAGFWRAVGREVPPEPDHLASLLGLYAALLEEEAEGVPATAGVALIRRSRRALLEEHLAPWAFSFLGRVRELGGPHHARWSDLLESALAAELATEGPIEILPTHLREAPGLPDPRDEGATAFLAGLLAPVRAGFLLTRADLGRIAARLDLGLRAGERRYALEHLVAQDPPGVLGALADEADRQAAAHEGRIGTLGSPAVFLGGRARGTANLLRLLSADAREGDLGAPEPAATPGATWTTDSP